MKNILFITYDFPYPTNTGGKNRAFNMLKFSTGHKKYLLSFTRDDFRHEYIEKLKKIGVETVATAKRKKVVNPTNMKGLVRGWSIFKSLYYSKDTADKILSIIKEKKIDIVHFESFYTSFFISDEIKKLGVKQVFGTENVEHIMYKNYAAGANIAFSPFIKYQASLIKKEEEELFKKADICIAVSDPDYRHVANFNRCELIRNGVDTKELEFRDPDVLRATKLLFVGNFSYFPNIDAITFFYNKVFLKLPEEFRLLVVGKKGKTLGIDDERVDIREFIPEISNAYQKTDIMVAPIRMGGGTNFKILEAWATGVPVVSLPQRLEGLAVTSGKNIIIVNNENEFREKIISLSADLNLRKEIAEAARRLVEREYSWEEIGKKLSMLWEKI